MRSMRLAAWLSRLSIPSSASTLTLALGGRVKCCGSHGFHARKIEVNSFMVLKFGELCKSASRVPFSSQFVCELGNNPRESVPELPSRVQLTITPELRHEDRMLSPLPIDIWPIPHPSSKATERASRRTGPAIRKA
ncbi:exported hypothetical protein [Cupriavidus taiwanensis]|nr:exported hypothetical protein [Cupriavidus taiwanensis]SOZ34596.1 exported hypothetical protein [Cupriavidus taiwanensis]SOZ53448.1 exported hypothetical protein [Cupriavidus taiwanensis]SOZ91609.1 exported hypothetical protein [Cupriavidus taiwanensis]SOZ93751.1 exported hypothetical protein [Cupriavidus taiwanensis]